MDIPAHWDDGAQPDFLLSVNDRMLQVREKLLEVAETPVPLALCGEKGLGKEALAQAVHRWSPRAGGPFVRVNGYAVSSGQLTAELFGASAAGSPLARAAGGTTYLSGLETFGTGLCDRLASTLGRLQGDTAHAPRIVLSTEAKVLDGSVKRLIEGDWGSDARTSVFRVDLPPLRERPEDIGLLAQHLLQLYGPFYSSRIKQVRSSLIDLFKQYPWPGNVRELERLIRRFLVLEDESAIRRELEERIWRGNGRAASEPDDFTPGMKLTEIGRLAAQRAEARAIRRVLEQTRWNKKAAALELGVSYKSLLNKVRDYRLDC